MGYARKLLELPLMLLNVCRLISSIIFEALTTKNNSHLFSILAKDNIVQKVTTFFLLHTIYAAVFYNIKKNIWYKK